MAKTEYAANAPEVGRFFSRSLFREALAATYINKFIGEGSDSLIQVKNEFKKGGGDTLNYTLRMQLSGAGVSGDGTLEGNEEPLTTYVDSLQINQLRHAVRSAGRMTEQRIPWSIREEARAALTDWWADRWDTSFFNQMAGYTPQTDLRFTGMNAVTAPTTVIRPTGANDQALGSSNIFTLSLIDSAVAAAKMASPLLRPLRIRGEERWAMFLHPYQVRDLRTNTSTGQWLDIQKAAMQGGELDDNPIRTGALGMYNGAVLYESRRVPMGVNSSTGASISTVRRAFLCGAQAAVMGFGKGYDSTTSMDWVEERFDYQNQLGVSAGSIFGLKKARFNSLDFSTIVVSTYAA